MQQQQEPFFELDETLWVVVARREICPAEQCIYREEGSRLSTRKHYHATCSHTHHEGHKKSMRFHHHQLEKVKKHQRSHQARAPREHGLTAAGSGLPSSMASSSPAFSRAALDQRRLSPGTPLHYSPSSRVASAPASAPALTPSPSRSASQRSSRSPGYGRPHPAGGGRGG
ncbi:unnamed protein product, partial [Discosporangium mesarthrocarpum]